MPFPALPFWTITTPTLTYICYLNEKHFFETSGSGGLLNLPRGLLQLACKGTPPKKPWGKWWEGFTYHVTASLDQDL